MKHLTCCLCRENVSDIQLFILQQSARSVMSPCAELDIDPGDTSDKRHYKLQLQYYTWRQ